MGIEVAYVGDSSYFAVWRAYRAGSDRRKVKVVNSHVFRNQLQF